MSKQNPKPDDNRETSIKCRKADRKRFASLARLKGLSNPDAFSEALSAWESKEAKGTKA